MERLKRKYIGDKAFYKLVFSISFPIMVQNGLTNFVNLLDNIMVGQLGTEQMSGVAIVNNLIFVFFLMNFGGLSGAGIYTAQFYGNKDDEGIRNTFRFKLWLGLFIVLVTGALLLLFGGDFIQLFLNSSADGGDLEAALSYGLDYLGIILLMLPAVSFSQVYISTLRECGQTVVPMVAGIVAVLTNLVLDYVFIFGKLGLPAMGVKGAAFATVIARYVEMLIVLVWAVKNSDTHTYFKGIYRTLRVPWDLTKKLLKSGLTIMMNEGLWSVGIVILAQAYSIRGLNVVAGQSIASTIGNIFNIVFIALGDAVAIIIGQLLGSGDMKKAKDYDNKIIATAVLSSVVIGSLLFLVSGLFPQLYNTNEHAKMLATHFIMVQAVFMPKDSFLHTSYFTIRAGGKTMITFLFDSVSTMLISVPVAFVLTRFTALGAPTVFAIVHAADIVKCMVGYIMIKNNIWMKNLVK